MNRALRIGDAVTFRERGYEEVCRYTSWLRGVSWAQWDACNVPLRIEDTSGGGSVRRVFYLTTGDRRAIVWPSAVKLDDRPRRNKLRAEIEAEKAAQRAAKARGKKSAIRR